MHEDRTQQISDPTETLTAPPKRRNDRRSRRRLATLAAALLVGCVGTGALFALTDHDGSTIGTAAAAPAAARPP